MGPEEMYTIAAVSTEEALLPLEAVVVVVVGALFSIDSDAADGLVLVVFTPDTDGAVAEDVDASILDDDDRAAR